MSRPVNGVVAVLDAQALLTKGFLEFAVRLGGAGAVTLRWSDDIVGEALEKACEKWDGRWAEMIRTLLAEVPDALLHVVADDEAAAGWAIDPDDRHVAAAGVAARRMCHEDPQRWHAMDVLLVTDNVRDFDLLRARRTGVDVVTRDAFGRRLVRDRPAAVARTVQRIPDERYRGFLERMRRDGLTSTADAIEAMFDAHGAGG